MDILGYWSVKWDIGQSSTILWKPRVTHVHINCLGMVKVVFCLWYTQSTCSKVEVVFFLSSKVISGGIDEDAKCGRCH